jgi:magnesium transporter
MKLNPSNTSIVKRLLSGRNSRPLLSIVNKIEPADLASLMGQFGLREKKLLLDALIKADKAASTLLEMPESQLEDFLKHLEAEKCLRLIVSAPEEDAAFLLNLMPDSQQNFVFDEMEPELRARIEQILSYPEDSAGRIMQTNAFAIPSNITAGEGLQLLRERAQEQSIYYIYCVDEEQRLDGVVSLRDLATALPEAPIETIIKREVVTVSPENTSEDVAQVVSHYDFIAIPVVNKQRQLIGLITIDDVVDIIQDQVTANLYAQAGLQEDDRVYSPNNFKIKNRLPWMLLNLILAAVASSVVSLFENTMEELILLAVLKNIVAGMGGNTAIQTMTVVTRGLAIGDFNFITHSKAILKETLVGITIGLITGLSAGLLVYVWKGQMMVAIVIFLSMVLNSLVASCFGAMVPILINKMKKDPATGSGVIVTMITDIFSFFSFLGIATLGLRLLH